MAGVTKLVPLVCLLLISVASPALRAADDSNTQIAALIAAAGLNPSSTLLDGVVQLTASVKSTPANITLSWQPIAKNKGFVIERRDRDAAWSQSATLPASATSWSDSTVVAGRIYEYRVATAVPTLDMAVVQTIPAFANVLKEAKEVGYDLPTADFGKLSGTITSAIEAPLNDNRGAVVLLVERSQAEPLKSELERLRQDLAGDGWKVLRHDVAAGESIGAIRDRVLKDQQAGPMDLKSVFIIGHLPIPYSGDYCPDGHADRIGAQPADVYYGSIDGAWTDASVDTAEEARRLRPSRPTALPENANRPGDGRFDQSEIPGKLWLQVGRVDFANMPALAPATETELLRRYLNKDHAWRHKALSIKPGCLVEDHLSSSIAAIGWSPCISAASTCVPVCGAEGIVFANGNWLKTLCDAGSVFAFAYAGSSRDHCGGIVATKDLAANDPKVAFAGLYGSYFGDWAVTNNVLRGMLAGKTGALGSFYAGSPCINLQAMALGETAGYAIWWSQHAENCPGPCAGRVHIALMGDPTLRIHVVSPPSDVVLARTGNSVKLTWKPAEDATLGYHVYRFDALDSSPVRLTQMPNTACSFTDSAPGGTYMVRAVRLEVSRSGSYFNASQGAFAVEKQ